MFEAIELGRKVSKEEFARQEPELRSALLEAQQQLRESRCSVIVIVSGVEGARKSEVVNRLHEWLDPRGVRTTAFWDETDEERLRPRYWRFWRALPARGVVGVLFGSWYTQPIIDRAFDKVDAGTFERELQRIEDFERTLALDGTIVVKLWFHLSKEQQRARLEEIEETERAARKDEKRRKKDGDDPDDPEEERKARGKAKGKDKEKGKDKDKGKDKAKGKGKEKGKKARDDAEDAPEAEAPGGAAKAKKGGKKGNKGKDALKLSPLVERFAPLYDTFAQVSERAIRVTDTADCPWTLIEAADREHRDLEAGRTLLAAIQKGLARHAVPAPRAPMSAPATPAQRPTLLDRVDLVTRLDDAAYDERIDRARLRLNRLGWELHNRRRSCVVVFEGWDAAGKGGAIRRVTSSMDARLYNVVPIAAPTDEERAHHYLWRFWRHIPLPGCVRIFDRSWYGRVLVERVEGFAADDEWRRSFHEINQFEDQLAAHGLGVAKLWLHISPEEQLRRFQERERTPWKTFKITAEDWRNREKWPLYETAVNEMVERTSTAAAPWTLVPADDKRVARVTVVETVADAIERVLDGGNG